MLFSAYHRTSVRAGIKKCPDCSSRIPDKNQLSPADFARQKVPRILDFRLMAEVEAAGIENAFLLEMENLITCEYLPVYTEEATRSVFDNIVFLNAHPNYLHLVSQLTCCVQDCLTHLMCWLRCTMARSKHPY